MRCTKDGIVVSVEEIAEYAVIVETAGLVLGNKHSEGGIHIYTPYDQSGNEYLCAAEMEGGEFLIAQYLSPALYKKLEEINSYNEEEDYITEQELFDMGDLDGLLVYDMRGKDKVFVSDKPITVINHNATKRYLKVLAALSVADQANR